MDSTTSGRSDKLGGDKVNRIVKEIRVKYKGQPAMLEELNRVPGTGSRGENK